MCKAGRPRLFGSRANFQPTHSTAGRNNFFKSHVKPKNTSIHGDFIQNYVHKLGFLSLKFCYRGLNISLTGRMRSAGLNLAKSDVIKGTHRFQTSPTCWLFCTFTGLSNLSCSLLCSTYLEMEEKLAVWLKINVTKIKGDFLFTISWICDLN